MRYSTLKRSLLPGLIAAAVTLIAGSAAAGNHFLLEFDGGLATPMGVDADTDAGAAWGGTFGVGGRIRGFAPAYYLVGTVGRSGYDFVGPPQYGNAHVERDQLDWSVGGRMYLPMSHRLRLMLQISAGETTDRAVVRRTGYRPLEIETDVFTVQTAAGLQYRLSDNISLGAIGDFSFYPDSEELKLATLSAGGADDDGGFGRAGLALTTTLHF